MLKFSAQLLSLALFVQAAPTQAADGKRILVLAPHEDDETLGCAGVIEAALQHGDQVQVVVATNGDFTGPAAAQVRIRETLQALASLGLSAHQVHFLGYGDGTLNLLYNAPTDQTVIRSHAGAETYGSPLAGDYHAIRFGGVHAPYTRASFQSDLSQVLSDFRPTDVYVTGLYDAHPDHTALFQFTMDAVTRLKQQHPRYAPVVHQYWIHASDDDRLWPGRLEHPHAVEPFAPPAWFEQTTAWNWAEREIVPVPVDMQVPPEAPANRKHHAISLYPSQTPETDHGFLYSFVKADEFFFPIDMANLAPLARITASSENAPAGQQAARIADGKQGGAPRFGRQEWVTQGELAGAWVELSWDKPHKINEVVLYDRPNLEDQVLGGSLVFSDGSRVPFGALPNNGRAFRLRFAPRSALWLRVDISAAAGKNVGLAEVQVFAAGHRRAPQHRAKP